MNELASHNPVSKINRRAAKKHGNSDGLSCMTNGGVGDQSESKPPRQRSRSTREVGSATTDKAQTAQEKARVSTRLHRDDNEGIEDSALWDAMSDVSQRQKRVLRQLAGHNAVASPTSQSEGGEWWRWRMVKEVRALVDITRPFENLHILHHAQKFQA